MNFIEAVIIIHESPDLEFCDDESELEGLYPSICVYHDGQYAGKLRWPSIYEGERVAGKIDEDLLVILENKRKEKAEETKEEYCPICDNYERCVEDYKEASGYCDYFIPKEGRHEQK